MTNQAFEVAVKIKKVATYRRILNKPTLVIYRVWTNLSFLSGKRASICAYSLDFRGGVVRV